LYDSEYTAIVAATVSNNSLRIEDLPPLIRARIASILGIRALIAQVRMRGERQSNTILNHAEKTVARCWIESWHLDSTPNGCGTEAIHGLRLEGIKGYLEDLQAIRDRLSTTLSHGPAPFGFMDTALTAQGRKPGDNTAKPYYEFTADAPAIEALAVIGGSLLEIIVSNEYGVSKDIDTEFLHDFRIAVRRTRSLLKHFAKSLPSPQIAHFRTEFAWLGRTTSLSRDYDVVLLRFPAYESLICEGLRDRIPALRQHIQDQRQHEFKRQLVAALRSKRYVDLKTQWRGFLDTQRQNLSSADAETPIGVIAAACMRTAHKRVLRAGRDLRHDTSPQRLHDLRIQCKRLRYLLEFYHHLYDARHTRTPIKQLKTLQDVLGEFQDFTFESALLTSIGADLANDPRLAMTIGALVQGISSGAAQFRQRIAKRFARFDTTYNTRTFQSLHAHSLKSNGSRN
jgi:CHAD domain-containing protein